MCRYVDHIESVFGSEEGKKKGYPGHPEIELALVRLYRVTGEKRYLKLSKFFIDQRGQKPHYFDIEARARGQLDHSDYFGDYTYEYVQSHKPVREQIEATGHAVSAMYLYSGMADVAVECGDYTLIEACRKLWDSVTKITFILREVLVRPVMANPSRFHMIFLMIQPMPKHVRLLGWYFSHTVCCKWSLTVNTQMLWSGLYITEFLAEFL